MCPIATAERLDGHALTVSCRPTITAETAEIAEDHSGTILGVLSELGGFRCRMRRPRGIPDTNNPYIVP
jgi:hypothetical protein